MRYQLINFKKNSGIYKTLPTGKPDISKSKPMRKSFTSNTLTTKPTKKMADKRDNQQARRNVVEAEMQWNINYGCFFAKPRCLPPTSSPLLRCNISKKCNGVWLSSDSRMSLQLVRHSNALVLLISSGPKIYEEHHILKLSFCWPQLSCQEQGPSRPSRVVFACYRDCSGQVQKFAMRFLTSSDSEAFVNCLKESLNSTIDFGHGCKFGSESSCPDQQNLRNGVCIRKVRDFYNENSSGNSEHPGQPQLTGENMRNTCSEEPLLTHDSGAEVASMPSSCTDLLTSVSCIGAENACSEEPLLTHDSGAEDAFMPSSFTDLLTSVSCNSAEKGVEHACVPFSFTDLLTSVSCTSAEKEVQETLPEFYQNSRVDGCKSDPSFHEMLTALEMFIKEVGGDLAL